MLILATITIIAVSSIIVASHVTTETEKLLVTVNAEETSDAHVVSLRLFGGERQIEVFLVQYLS